MIITNIVQKNRTIVIYLDNGEKIRCPSHMFYNVEIYEGMEVEPYDVRTLIKTAAKENISNKAMELLGTAFLSKHQLVLKLRKRKYSEKLIKHAVRFCKEYDLLDDKRFAKIALRSMILKNKSRRSISRYMKKAGVNDRIIEKMIYKISDRREIISLKRQMIKYYPLCESKKSPEKSLLQYLLGKGFTYDMAGHRAKKYCKKMKDLDKN